MADSSYDYRDDYARQPGTLALEDEDRLPWLEAVDEDMPDRGLSPIKLLLYVLGALAALGLVFAGIMLLQRRPSGAPEIIKAPTAPYKVPPADGGAMTVPGEGDATFNTSQGKEPQGRIDLARGPETPATVPPPTEPAATASAPAVPAKPAAPTAAPASTQTPLDGAGILQLGAFDSEAVANAAWRTMARRFPDLQGKAHQVTTANVGGGTVYRLRAQVGDGASALCGRLKAAGQNCMVVR